MLALAKCSRCSAELPPDAPRGHCACCLLALALSTSDEAEDSPEKAEPSIEALPLPEIENYRILRHIGEGGFGVVYLAEQLRPVRRLVALKIIKPGMDTRAVVTRFAAERQALAVLDHPHIARVLDAGATQNGHPYFVMDYVAGVAITTFCAERKLSVPERLGLMLKVCDAILHAHQKGVVHRDLKPGNILVVERDGHAAPVVIDFGIAKAVGEQRLVDATLYTAFEHCLGTPAYMSPEQASLDGVDVDTRTDIYSLGVLLYELLAGALPFAATGGNASAEELRRRVREDEPPRPSARFAALPEEAAQALARERQTDPRRLHSLLRGDLDWIVTTCLAKDRARRYASAGALAADLQRHLASEPIAARPPSRLYQFQRFSRRHRVALLTAAAFALILLTAAVVSFRQMLAARAAEQRALIEGAKSQQVATFLSQMLQGVDPMVARGRDTTLMRALLERTVQRITTEMRDVPEVEGEILRTIGWTYHRLDDEVSAERHLSASVAIFRRLPGADYELAASLNWLAYVIGGRSKADALAPAREAYAIYQRLLTDPRTPSAVRLNIASDSIALGKILTSGTQRAERMKVLRGWLDLQRRTLGGDHIALAETLDALGQTEAADIAPDAAGDLKTAEAHYREALAIYTRAGSESHYFRVRTEAHLCTCLIREGDYVAAEPLASQVLAETRSIVGHDHPDVILRLVTLASVKRTLDHFDAAESLLLEAIDLYQRIHSTATFGTFSHELRLVAEDLEKRGETARAEKLMQFRSTLPDIASPRKNQARESRPSNE